MASQWSSLAVATTVVNMSTAALHELEQRINAEISAKGPISFSRFMERALTEPEIGYYVTSTVRAGRDGDFITAPELHSILGSALARMAVEVWRRVGEPDRFRWVEYGAGSGTLILAVLAQLVRDTSPLLRALEVQSIDTNTYRLSELRNAVEALPKEVRPTLVDGDAPPCAGFVMANEYLDALPFNIYVGRAGAPHGIAERRVGLDQESGARIWVEQPLSEREAARVAGHVGVQPAALQLAEGQLAEACFGLSNWVREVPTRISDGAAVVIDYGRDGVLLRDASSRMAGTALAYQGHRATTDLLSEPGGRDLTAHVDLTALRRAAVEAGLVCVASTTQAALLAGAGLDDELDRLRRGPEATLEGAVALRSALAQLLDPRGMGGFAVELFALGGSEHAARLSDPTNPLPGTAAPIRPLV